MKRRMFSFFTAATTSEWLEHYGQIYDESSSSNRVACCKCPGVETTQVFPPTLSAPAWFFCSACEFTGDLLDYGLAVEKLPEEKGETLLHQYKRRELVHVSEYLQHRKNRLSAERFWATLQSDFATGLNRTTFTQIPQMLAIQKNDWNRVFRQLLYPRSWSGTSDTVKSVSAMGDAAQALQGPNYSLKSMTNYAIARIEWRPGELRGFAYIGLDGNELRVVRKWLPGAKRCGFCFSQNLFDTHASSMPNLLCTSFVDGLQYITKFGQDFGFPPRIAILSSLSGFYSRKQTTPAAKLLKSVPDIVVFGRPVEASRSFATRMGFRFSDFIVPANTNKLYSMPSALWKPAILERITKASPD